MEEDNNKLKIAFQRCNGFVTCSGRSVELIYITFIHAGMYTLGLYPEENVTETFYFLWPSRTEIKLMCNSHRISRMTQMTILGYIEYVP